jgi:hypothetical protein
MKAQITHFDGKTKVMATVFVCNGEVSLDYKIKGKSYALTMDEDEALEKGILKKKTV